MNTAIRNLRREASQKFWKTAKNWSVVVLGSAAGAFTFWLLTCLTIIAFE